jgi:formyltetrahydrofolate deformylase
MTSPAATEPLGDYVLTLSCEDRPGIVHAMASFLMECGGNIRESQQFGDREHNRFFMRVDFETAQRTDAAILRERVRRDCRAVRDDL